MDNTLQDTTASQGQSQSSAGNEMQQCISDCLQSYQGALSHISHCLQKGGEHASPRHIQSLIASADICETSARLMLLGSEKHAATCAACAEVLRDCAEHCEKLSDDEDMQRLAQTFQRTADSCERMASGTH